ncbi:MAG: tryptophan synthase subunit alpha [Helicobacter sp.]|uniref:tryptophan synthase subunit alpha n=1 Tax=Helicobacter sp. TaxID=218 RepID=UPI002A80031F|nr:tryptophan synthase subunit alpha [Helicobacter sp.]MDY4426007.1 tryptophan synthase subunit alpha [Helicobacter sp.]
MKEENIKLMGHIVALFPSFGESLEAALGIARGGAEYLEVQFPFSDPNADGVVIASACEESLKNGFNTDLGFEFLQRLNEAFKQRDIKTKILIMTYGNILFAYGIEKFLKQAKECGVFGLIVPDLSLQNDENLFELSKRFGLENITLIAPCTETKRIEKLDRATGSLIYVVARNGITGDGTSIDSTLLEYIKRVKKHTTKPIALGFGIYSREQIDALRGIVPIVVVGSAFVRMIAQSAEQKVNLQDRLYHFTRELLGITF